MSGMKAIRLNVRVDYEGSSGNMEVVGSEHIWCRSVAKLGIPPLLVMDIQRPLIIIYVKLNLMDLMWVY